MDQLPDTPRGTGSRFQFGRGTRPTRPPAATDRARRPVTHTATATLSWNGYMYVPIVRAQMSDVGQAVPESTVLGGCRHHDQRSTRRKAGVIGTTEFSETVGGDLSKPWLPTKGRAGGFATPRGPIIRESRAGCGRT